jgi:hypothetical protein
MNTSTEYLCWDNTEAVTYTVYGQTVSNIGYTQPYSISVAKRRSISNADIPSQKTGILTADDLVWLIPAAVIDNEVRPNINDYITDSSNRIWTVLSTQLNNLQSTWRLVTRDLILAEKLSDSMALYRPTNTIDAAGSRVTSYTLITDNIPARVQETGTEIADTFGKKAVKTRYDIHLGIRIDWQATDQLRNEAGDIFQIVSGSAPDIIDLLQVVTAEVIL